MYNHSILSADRATHLKIVLLPLVAATLLAIAAINVRAGDAGSNIVRAGHGPSLYASTGSAVIR